MQIARHCGVMVRMVAKWVVPAKEDDMIQSGLLSLTVYKGRCAHCKQELLGYRGANIYGQEQGLLHMLKPRQRDKMLERIQLEGMELRAKAASYVLGSRREIPFNLVRVPVR